MTKIRYVVKRRDNNKEASRMTLELYTLLANHHRENGISCGILALRVPKNDIELDGLKKTKEKYVVKAVKARNTNNPENIFKNLEFLVALAEWIMKRTVSKRAPYLHRIGFMLEQEQRKIVDESNFADVDLMDIFETFDPRLLTHARKKRWWVDQLTEKKRR